MKIGILTDSTCDLSSEIINKYNIEVIPLSVQINEKSYKDGVDLSSKEFFQKISDKEKLQELPTTSQPSVGSFVNKYKELFKKYDYVISIHLASALSGTYEAANLAARQFFDNPQDNIKIIDSKSASLGLGFQVLLAAKLLKNGKNVQQIEKTLSKARNNLNVYFTVYDLEFLQKGGRIGKARAFIGSVLNFNPLLKLDSNSGEIEPAEKIRGTAKTIKKMVEMGLEGISAEDNLWMGILKGNEDKYFNKFNKMIEKNLAEKSANSNLKFTTNVSPVLGAHVGPYVYSIITLKGEFLQNGE